MRIISFRERMTPSHETYADKFRREHGTKMYNLVRALRCAGWSAGRIANFLGLDPMYVGKLTAHVAPLRARSRGTDIDDRGPWPVDRLFR